MTIPDMVFGQGRFNAPSMHAVASERHRQFTTDVIAIA